MKKRSEVRVEDCWDLSDLFNSVEEQQSALEQLEQDVDKFIENYRGKIEDCESPDYLLASWRDLEKIMADAIDIAAFAYLRYSVETTNQEKMRLFLFTSGTISQLSSKITFYKNELKKVDEGIIKEAMEKESGSTTFFGNHLKQRPYFLSPECEELLSTLNIATGSLPEKVYEAAKLSDLKFPDFEVDGKKYPLSFSAYEEFYAYHRNTKVRREAFRVFSQTLANYRNTIATAYFAFVKQDVLIAKKRGYDNVFQYLLQSQKVDESLYHRQVDVIMEKLAPHMRKYARKLKKNRNLDKLTYADLLLPAVDKNNEISREDAEKLIIEAVAVLGEDYQNIMQRAFEEKWIDYAENEGKSTGAFTYPSKHNHPYIMMNWKGKMPDAYTLIHELGHAGQSMISREYNNATDGSPTTYFIEAPSTGNEMLLSAYLFKEYDGDDEMTSYIASQAVGNTYYHNFVTHFLEAYWQREVYRAVAKGQTLTADDFDQLYLDTLKKFWGDEVEFVPGSEKTWMRQPHYYSGLYSYTYSAGLTIGTAVSLRIEDEGKEAAKDWLTTLALGGTKDPVELAATAGVDISTDKALCDTISYIAKLIDLI